MSVKSLQAEAKAAGLSWGTIKRSKGMLRVRAVKGGFDDGWTWQLPRSEGAHVDPVQNTLRPFGKVAPLRVFDPENGGIEGVEGSEGDEGAHGCGTRPLGGDAGSEPPDDGDDPSLHELRSCLDEPEGGGEPDWDELNRLADCATEADRAGDLSTFSPGLAVGQGLDGGDVHVGDDCVALSVGHGDEDTAVHGNHEFGVANGVRFPAAGDDPEGLERITTDGVANIIGQHTSIVAPERTPGQENEREETEL